MVRMMLTLTMKLGLRTKQVDYSNAFVQADIDGYDVYCELVNCMPTEFSLADGGKSSDYVLKLKKRLYELKQAPLLCGSRHWKRVYCIACRQEDAGTFEFK